MRHYIFLSFTTLALIGCDQSGVNERSLPTTNSNTTDSPSVPPSKPAVTGGNTGNPVLPPTTTSTPDPSTPTTVDSNEAVQPDNSAVNQRDRNDKAVVPTDQGNNQADIETTAEIRRRIVDLKDVSISGRNVKIITNAGKVTLRGPVASDDERTTIEGIAHDVAKKDNVTSQLEVAP